MLTLKLIHAVEFQEQIVTVNADGEQVKTWRTAWLDSATPLDAVPALVLSGPGRNPAPFEASQQQDFVAARITTQWFPGLRPTWRILWDDKIYNIHGIPDTDQTGRREWRITCVSGLNDG